MNAAKSEQSVLRLREGMDHETVESNLESISFSVSKLTRVLRIHIFF